MHDTNRLLTRLHVDDPEETGHPLVPAPSHDGPWREKLDALWASCLEDRRTGTRPPEDPTFVRPRNLLNAFHHAGDVFPRGHSTVIARKFLHPVGCVARVAYRPDPGNRCRGILAADSEGLLRVSNGNASDQGGFAAGVGLKFPRTDRCSADMVFGPPAFEVTDTDETVVSRDQQTWLGPNTYDPRYRDIRTLFWIFDRVREETCGMGFAGRAVSVAPLYDTDQDGESRVSEHTRPEPPIGLVMVPSEHFRAEWRRGSRWWRRRFTRVLPRVRPGLLYTVHARWRVEERAVRIGEVHLVEPFTTSRFGDGKLFFRHPPEPPDAALAALHEPEEPLTAP